MRLLPPALLLATLVTVPVQAKPPAPKAAPAPEPAPPRHPPTIDDLLRLRQITAFEPIPGGAGAVVQVQEYDGGERFAKDLWWVRPGAEPRRLTVGGRTRGSFTVSPDGTRVLFAGERGGKSGLFVLPLDGGEATVLRELPVDAGDLRWVGGRIWFSAAVYPECNADLDCTRKRAEEARKGPSALVYDDLYFRPWNAWRDGTYTALFSLDVATGEVRRVAGGRFDALPAPFGGREDYAVSRDGEVVVHAAKKVAERALRTNDDLFEVAGGAERKLTDNPASDRAPALSPDGRTVAYLAQATPGFESDLVRLWLLDRKTGDRFPLADGLDNWVHELVWTADGKAILFNVEEQGHLLLYRVEAKKGAVPVRLSGRHVDRRLALSGDGKSLLFTRESMTQPADLWALDLKTGAERRLTDLNGPALARWAMPRIEEVWYDGAKTDTGRNRVHAFVATPDGASPDAKLPLVVVVHGGPQGSWMNAFHPRWNALPLAAQGFAVVMPNPTGSTGYGQAFVNAISRDWGGRCYEDVLAILDWAATRPGIDATRACAMGGSFGGYMTNWIEGHTDRFKCLISHAGPSSLATKYGTTDELWFPEWEIGGTPWENPDGYAKWSPDRYAKSFRTPMLVIHGANDFRVPIEQALVMFTYLKRLGVEAKLVVFPDEDHFVARPLNRKFWYETVQAWLKDHLAAAK